MRSARDEVAGAQRTVFLLDAFVTLGGAAHLCNSCYCLANNAAKGDTLHSKDEGYAELPEADRLRLASIEYLLSRAMPSLRFAERAPIINFLLDACAQHGSALAEWEGLLKRAAALADPAAFVQAWQTALHHARHANARKDWSCSADLIPVLLSLHQRREALCVAVTKAYTETAATSQNAPARSPLDVSHARTPSQSTSPLQSRTPSQSASPLQSRSPYPPPLLASTAQTASQSRKRSRPPSRLSEQHPPPAALPAVS